MRKLIPVIVIGLIVMRLVFDYLFKTIPIVNIDNAQKAVQIILSMDMGFNLLILMLFIILYNIAKLSLHYKWFIAIGIVHTSTVGLLDTYPFLPINAQIFVATVAFNIFWSIIYYLVTSLILYYYICLKRNWLELA